MRLSLDERVEQDQEAVRAQIADTGGMRKNTKFRSNNLYDFVLRTLSEDTRHTDAQLASFHALETALSVFRQSSQSLREEMDLASQSRFVAAGEAAEESEDKVGRGRIAQAAMFSNRYALYMAGKVGLTLLQTEPAPTDIKRGLGPLESVQDAEPIAEYLIQDAREMLEDAIRGNKEKNTPVDDATLKETLATVFTSWVNQYAHTTYNDVIEEHKLAGLEIAFRENRVKDGVFEQQSTEVFVSPEFHDVRLDGIIGHKKDSWTDKALTSALKTMGYNHKRKRNPFKPPVSVFIFGHTGVGKTYGVSAVIQTVMDEARSRGKGAKARFHSVSEYGSKYQNETQGRLMGIIQEDIAFPGPVYWYIADADTVYANRNDSRSSNEEKRTLGVYFKLFDGTFFKKQWGKYTCFQDANYVDMMDTATQGRIRGVQLYATRFDNVDDFSAYVDLLTKVEGESVLDASERQEVAEWLLNSELDHRSIANVVGGIVSDFPIDYDLVFNKSFEEQEQHVKAYGSSISTQLLLDKLEAYQSEQDRINEESRQSRLKARMKLHEDLAAPKGPISG